MRKIDRTRGRTMPSVTLVIDVRSYVLLCLSCSLSVACRPLSCRDEAREVWFDVARKVEMTFRGCCHALFSGEHNSRWRVERIGDERDVFYYIVVCSK